MNSTVHYVYIGNYLKKTVTDSQIIGWLKLLEERGIIFDLLIITGVRGYLQSKKLLNYKIKEAKKILSGKIYKFAIIKPNTLLSDFLVLIVLLSITLQKFFTGKMLIIQTRSNTNHNSFKILKRIYPNFKLIYDSRGSLADEYLMIDSMQNNKRLNCKFNQYKKVLKREKNFVNSADKVLCVSNKLKKYHLKNKKDNDNKFIVIPGCSDSRDFYYSEKKRNRIRNKLNLGDRIALVYSGGLEQAWQMPEIMFKLFSKLTEKIFNIFFICLTPHVYIAEKYIDKFKIRKDNIWTDYIKYERIVDYLCAADAGILLREDSTVNNVASPTKFSEYILCGLPVIISKGIGDFTKFVEEKKIGLVIDHNSTDCERNIEQYLCNLQYQRKRIATIGKQFYSKQKYIDKLEMVYQELITI